MFRRKQLRPLEPYHRAYEAMLDCAEQPSESRNSTYLTLAQAVNAIRAEGRINFLQPTSAEEIIDSLVSFGLVVKAQRKVNYKTTEEIVILLGREE